MSLWKNILAGAAFLIVLQQYLKYHTYYESALSHWGALLILIGIWAIVWGGLAAIQGLRGKGDVTLTPLRLLFGSFLMIWLVGLGSYALMDPAVLVEPYDIYVIETAQGMELAVVEEGDRFQEGAQPYFFRGGTVVDWTTSQDFFPEELHDWFSRLTFSQFAGNLGVRLLKLFGWWALLLVGFHNLGAVVLRKKSFSAWGFFESIGAGMGLMMLALFTAGTLGQLTSTVVGVLAGVGLLLGLPKLPLLLSAVWNTKGTIHRRDLRWWTLPVVSLVGIVTSFNVLDALKPFPMGFDSLVQYHNVPNLLYHYGELISGRPAYNFELIISLGHFISGGSADRGIQVVFLGALLAFGALFMLLRKRFSWPYSLLLLSTLLSLPMMSFLLHLDPKIDLPLLFFSLLAIHQTLEWLTHRRQKSARKHLLLTGLWLGIAFGIKYTSLFLTATIMAVYATVAWGGMALIGVWLLAFGVLGQFSPPFMFVDFESPWPTVLHALVALSGLVVMGIAIRRKGFKKTQLTPFLLTGVVFLGVFSPWLIRNIAITETINSKTLLNGQYAGIVINEDTFELGEACVNAFTYNELAKYTGSEEAPSVLLPLLVVWESTINSELSNNRITDISFLFLGSLLFVILGRKKWGKDDPEWRYAAQFTLFYGLLWLTLARGIIWYGMPIFVGLLITYGKAWQSKRWIPGVLVVWMLMTAFLRYGDNLNQATGLLYGGGVIDRSVAQEQSLQGSEGIAAIVNAEENLDKNIYAVGDFIEYYLVENDQRLYRDNLLNDFVCYFAEGQNWPLAVERLQAQNMGFVIYSEHGLVAESNPMGPLHRQFEDFEAFAANYLEEIFRSRALTLYKVPDPE